MKSAETALARPADWGTLNMNRDEKMILAEAAHVLRFGGDDEEEESRMSKAISAGSLLLPKRADDRADDLWTTFNVVQERVIKGGLTGYARDEDGRTRRTTSREVKGVDQNIKLNKALWLLGERMAELKGLKAAA
jgi:hypothetical protein